MAKINAESIVELFETIKNNTMNSPFVSRASKLFEEAEANGVANVKLGFEAEEDDEDLSNPAKVTSTVMINKLVKLFSKMVKTIADHAKTIKFNRDMTEVVKEEVNTLKNKENEKTEDIGKLKAECKMLIKEMLDRSEEHCDEIQQRSLKGNLIVFSTDRV